MAFQPEAAPDNEKHAVPAEAVNLELVNMAPFGADAKVKLNGATEIPVKNGKSNGSDSAFSNDPYDEYFVPVNEHRKYMR
jgi:hypothetical protein